MNDLVQIMMMNTIGLSVLYETLRTASHFIYTSSSKRGEAYKCYAFIQGTGLDALLIDYSLDYDPNQLRSSFNWFINHKDRNGKNISNNLPSQG